MAELIYAACAIASMFCAALLIRSYLQTRLRLSLLSCLCFAGLALNNLLLFIDLVMTSQGIDLAILRGTVALVAVAILVFGLVMEDT
jgi:hypothetical protein